LEKKMTILLQLKIATSILLFHLCASPVQAQQSVNAAGGEAVGVGASVSFSIGQVDYIQVAEPTGRLNFGVQQPYDQETLISVLPFACLLYPNPTLGPLNLHETVDFETFGYTLFDLAGRILQQETGLEISTTLHLDTYPGGVYILQITSNKGEVWNCPIVKVVP